MKNLNQIRKGMSNFKTQEIMHNGMYVSVRFNGDDTVSICGKTAIVPERWPLRERVDKVLELMNEYTEDALMADEWAHIKE